MLINDNEIEVFTFLFDFICKSTPKKVVICWIIRKQLGVQASHLYFKYQKIICAYNCFCCFCFILFFKVVICVWKISGSYHIYHWISLTHTQRGKFFSQYMLYIFSKPIYVEDQIFTFSNKGIMCLKCTFLRLLYWNLLVD